MGMSVVDVRAMVVSMHHLLVAVLVDVPPVLFMSMSMSMSMLMLVVTVVVTMPVRMGDGFVRMLVRVRVAPEDGERADHQRAPDELRSRDLLGQREPREDGAEERRGGERHLRAHGAEVLRAAHVQRDRQAVAEGAHDEGERDDLALGRHRHVLRAGQADDHVE